MLIEALTKGATPAARALLAKEPDVGTVQIGDRRTVLKYVYARETTAGRQITAVTAEPIALAGAGLPAAGFDLGLVLLDVDGSGTGRGDLVPATKIRVNDDGAFETEDYNGVVLHLSISLFLEVGFFSASMFVLYLAFVPPERVKAFIARQLHKT